MATGGTHPPTPPTMRNLGDNASLHTPYGPTGSLEREGRRTGHPKAGAPGTALALNGRSSAPSAPHPSGSTPGGRVGGGRSYDFKKSAFHRQKLCNQNPIKSLVVNPVTLSFVLPKKNPAISDGARCRTDCRRGLVNRRPSDFASSPCGGQSSDQPREGKYRAAPAACGG